MPGAEGKHQQSHLMDLLDISLGAASISSPPSNSDPWGMPVADATKSQVNFKQKKKMIIFNFVRMLNNYSIVHQ